jgi:hypothetical protein
VIRVYLKAILFGVILFPSRADQIDFTNRQVHGWTVHIDSSLWKEQKPATETALRLLKRQLKEIVEVIPAEAVQKLREVPLWFSPVYPGTKAKAEYHPDIGWLREHDRNRAMAKSVEFTNIPEFQKEMNRMPNFCLHELAHAFHDRVLEGGFDNVEIKSAYRRAQASTRYEKVERWFGNGRTNTFERAYAMSTPQEYFAECTEAFFGRNDFFPFTREELRQHDPAMFDLLEKLWGTKPK